MRMDRARTSTAPASSSSLCPACMKPVDSLRAGHVAILDGAFRYFCDARCKGAYVEAASKRPTLDAMTADPPPVTSSAAEASGLRTREAASGIRDEPSRVNTPRVGDTPQSNRTDPSHVHEEPHHEEPH